MTEPDLTAVANGTLEITVSIANALPPITADDVIWYFTPSNSSEPAVITEMTSDRYTISMPTETSARLRIHPVELEDEGNYTVNVSNVAGSDAVTISVDVECMLLFHALM